VTSHQTAPQGAGGRGSGGGVAVASALDGPRAILVRGLRKSYGNRAVVDGVDFEVNRGEVVGLLGPNGAGKTTSFYMVMGLVRPDGGRVLLDDKDISQWPMHKRARSGIGYLAQDPSVFRRLSVEDNIRAILEMMPLTRKQQDVRCEELLHDLDLVERRRATGVKLSGGERRRTEIARALATDPAFILLDEPFTGVDPINREEIQQIVRRLRDRGIGILITDHNEMATLDIVDRAYIVHSGHIEAHGTPGELLANERARELYFGESFGRNGTEGSGQSSRH
jgi:lipopolysaccharide export system ATP-binding protein